jgi:protein ImuB
VAAKRVAVVLIPNFAVAVFGKTQHSRARGAFALVDTIEDTSPVVAINQTAAQAGVTCGMTAAQAQAFCPGLLIYQRDPIAERAETHAVAAWLGSLSPSVHEDSPGRYLLDASGMSLLYHDETTYATRIITTLRPLGYTVQIGLAQNPFVARVAAERAEISGYLIVPSQEEKTFLSGLGREYLDISAETASLLHDLGIEQISQLSAFPINEMTERFGAEGTTIASQSHGDVGRRSDATLVAEKPDTFSPEEFTSTRFFVSPLAQAQYLRRHISQLLGDLFEQLKPLDQGCACVDITLHLDNRTDRSISLAVDKPTISVRPFLRQWQTHIDKLTLDADIAGLTVTIPHLRPLLIEQMAIRTHRASSATPVTLPDSVYRPCLRPGLLPENCFELLPVASSPRWPTACRGIPDVTGHLQMFGTHPKEWTTRRLWHAIGLRLLQPPRTVRVQLDNHRPANITWAGRHRAIIRTLGPWELSGNWWHAPFHRQYYEIITDTHQRYLIFCEEEHIKWFMQGVFD